MKLLPASRNASMIRLASSSSHGAPEVPKFIAPRQARLTFIPDRPNVTYGIAAPFARLVDIRLAAPAPGRGQLRGTSLHGGSREGSGSRGRPRTRSPRMLRWISEVPPSIVLPRD